MRTCSRSCAMPQNLQLEDVQGKLKMLTRGQKSDNVINWMANTFRVLCDLAD